MVTKTRNQEYAVRIYEQVRKIRDLHPKEAPAYGRYAHKLPIMILTEGLVNAVSFVRVKNSDNGFLLQDITTLIGKEFGAGDVDGFLDVIRKADIETYMILTQKIQDSLVWYKRYSKTILNVEGEEE